MGSRHVNVTVGADAFKQLEALQRLMGSELGAVRVSKSMVIRVLIAEGYKARKKEKRA